ncbi:hypothetical protein [Halorhabdus sp. CUG00001]|uniref:hypothetical protein n=1 Tax=Halorhabdus sp. CUG00001 TaxID=2600297 RepID=UPI00131C260B|nr:hypothetical protein [Halorhabdus sp. CUG00001]
MTISQSSPQDLPRETVLSPDVDPHSGVVRCSLCGQELEDVGTPLVPRRFLEDLDVDRDVIPVFGYRCSNHRREHVIIPSPVDHAPESYSRVDARLDDRDGAMPVAVPNPVINA